LIFFKSKKYISLKHIRYLSPPIIYIWLLYINETCSSLAQGFLLKIYLWVGSNIIYWFFIFLIYYWLPIAFNVFNMFSDVGDNFFCYINLLIGYSNYFNMDFYFIKIFCVYINIIYFYYANWNILTNFWQDYMNLYVATGFFLFLMLFHIFLNKQINTFVLTPFYFIEECWFVLVSIHLQVFSRGSYWKISFFYLVTSWNPPNT
jgi:hypothetical protein